MTTQFLASSDRNQKLHPSNEQDCGPIRPRSDREITLDPTQLADNGIFGFEPMDIRSRSFMMLRSQLLNRFYREGGRLLAVTSTQPGNGKTHVAANIAAAMSRIHPTILLDLDLRCPTLARRFGLSLETGIDDYLANDVTLPQTGIQIAAVDLVIHGGRQQRSDSATLLASDRMSQLMMILRSRATAPICIIDTPPILVLDDLMLITRHVDGVLMVIEEGNTCGSDIVDALRLIAPTPIIGTVLNKSLTGDRIHSSYGAYYN